MLTAFSITMGIEKVTRNFIITLSFLSLKKKMQFIQSRADTRTEKLNFISIIDRVQRCEIKKVNIEDSI
jgi:hypothetical protein